MVIAPVFESLPHLPTYVTMAGRDTSNKWNYSLIDDWTLMDSAKRAEVEKDTLVVEYILFRFIHAFTKYFNIYRLQRERERERERERGGAHVRTRIHILPWLWHWTVSNGESHVLEFCIILCRLFMGIIPKTPLTRSDSTCYVRIYGLNISLCDKV